MSVFERAGDGMDAIGSGWRFSLRIVGNIFNGSVLKYFGEALRQAGVLITGSLLIVLGLVFVLGAQCGIEGAYGAKAVGAQSSVGAFTALCDLARGDPVRVRLHDGRQGRTGIVAELGSMRISDEIDALEVMASTASSTWARPACSAAGSCCPSSTRSRSSWGSSRPT